MLSEQGLESCNCSELEVPYGILFRAFDDMSCLQYKMHSEVFIISGLVDFLLCSSLQTLLLLHLFPRIPAFFAQNSYLDF